MTTDKNVANGRTSNRNPATKFSYKMAGMPKDTEYNRLPFGRQIEHARRIEAFKKSAKHDYFSTKRRSFAAGLKEFKGLYDVTEYFTLNTEGPNYKDDSAEIWYKTAEQQNPRGSRNAGDGEMSRDTLEHAAFDAGKKWITSGAYETAGVANARVHRYGFLRWSGRLSVGEERRAGTTSARLEKAFREGVAAGKWSMKNESTKKRNGSDEIRELTLYINNNSTLYRQQTAIHNNLISKKSRGMYNHALAQKALMHLANEGAKMYAKEYGGQWSSMFSVADRTRVARALADDFQAQYKSDKGYEPTRNPRVGDYELTIIRLWKSEGASAGYFKWERTSPVAYPSSGWKDAGLVSGYIGPRGAFVQFNQFMAKGMNANSAKTPAAIREVILKILKEQA